MDPEKIKAYEEARERLNKAVEGMRSAEGDDALKTAEAEFRSAQTEVARLDAELTREEELDEVQGRFKARTVKASEVPTPAAELGMDEREVKSYSLTRAIMAAATGDWRGAELEREASDEIAKRLGREPSGFFVPMDVQRDTIDLEAVRRVGMVLGQRDLTVGTDSAGGYLVDTDLKSASFIEMLRNRMAVLKAGATVLSGLVGDVAIPRQTGGATFYWVAESGAPSESQQTVGQVSLTPHTGGAYTDISRKLLKQSSIDVENFVRADLAAITARGIDLAALHGTGADNQPTGIASTSGIGSVVCGTNGGALTWADIVNLETEVAVDNADVGNLAYMTNAKVRGLMKRTLITATYGEQFLWDRQSAGTPVNGYPCHVTNQVSSTLTKGTTSGSCSAIFFGNFNDLVIGQWGVLDMLVDPYSGGTSGTLRVIALQDVDVAVRHAESFAAALDVVTT